MKASLSTHDPDQVTLTVNGLDYAGWMDVRISAGIERQARDFSIGITWKWPGSGEVPRTVKQGDRCEVRIGADRILTGYVFATPIRYDEREITLSIAGRSLTADLVDCGVDGPPSQWRHQGVVPIVQALVAPYGIEVVDEARAGGTLADHTLESGESVFESIDRLLRLSRLLSTDDERGRVVIACPGSAGRAADTLSPGHTMLSGDAPLDFTEVCSQYVCKGQRSGTDHVFGTAASEVQARLSDPTIARRRVCVLTESGQLTPELARQRVQWERANRLSRALQTTYMVRGWRQSNGQLWRHNQIVQVNDALIGFARDMLIVAVDYVKNEEDGTVTRLTVAPPDGFEAEPVKPKHVKKARKGDQFEYLLPADWDTTGTNRGSA